MWGCGEKGPRARGYMRETEKKDRKEGEKEGGKKEKMEKKSRTVTATTQ